MCISTDKLERLSYCATIIAAVVAVFTFYFGYIQFRATQILQRTALEMQREAMMNETEIAATRLLSEYSKIRRNNINKNKETNGDDKLIVSDLCIMITEAIYNITSGRGQWEPTIKAMIREQKEIIQLQGLNCDTFDPEFIKIIKLIISGPICVNDKRKTLTIE